MQWAAGGCTMRSQRQGSDSLELRQREGQAGRRKEREKSQARGRVIARPEGCVLFCFVLF